MKQIARNNTIARIKAVVTLILIMMSFWSMLSRGSALSSLALGSGLVNIFTSLLALATFDTEDILIAILVEAIFVKVLFECMVRFESWSEDHASTSIGLGVVLKLVTFLNAASACKALWYSAYSSKLRSTPSFLNSIFVSPSLGIVLFAVAAAIFNFPVILCLFY